MGQNQDKGKKYLTASIYYVIGNVIGQGVVLLSSGIFTRMMSQEAYGLVNTYAAWVLVLNTFIGLNLFITVRNAYIDYFEKYEEFVSSVLLLSLLAFVVLTAGIIGGIKLFHIKTDLFVVLLAAVQAISLHTINYEMAVQSMKNQYKQRTLLLIFPNCIHTFLSIGLIMICTSNPYYSKILGNMLGLLLFAVAIIICTFSRQKPRYIKEYWKYALIISLPAILNTLSDLVLIQSDRIMLTELVGADETAVYSLVYNIGSIIFALYTAINGAWGAWFYKSLAQKEEQKIKNVQTVYLYGLSLLTIGILTVSPEIIKILSPSSYWQGIDYVNLIVISSFLMFIYAFFTTYLMYLKKTGMIAINTVIAAMFNVGLNYLLIPDYKAVGAAVATMVSYIILFLLHYRAAKKQTTDCFCIAKMFGSIGIVTGYGIVFYFIRNQFVIRSVIVVILASIVLAMAYKYWQRRGEKK